MSKFIQIHSLTFYPASNLNRDDLGRPKTVLIGGTNRLRISSQCLKRAWRTSDIFSLELSIHLGIRTKGMGKRLFDLLQQQGVSEAKAREWILPILEKFGALDKSSKKKANKNLEHAQLIHFSPEETHYIEQMIYQCAQEQRGPTEKELKLLPHHRAVDIALFGRMLASYQELNVEAAVQVAHAFTVDQVAIQEDYFTAIDDLNQERNGAHVGETEFGSGLFYSYICIDTELLKKNLQGDLALTNQAIKNLLIASSIISPKGKQNSFASRARASYVLVEKGRQQPRSLAAAFIEPIRGKDLLGLAINALETTKQNFDRAYGPCSEADQTLDCKNGKGSLEELVSFISI
jgi:CRISPR system Cascade subunit CasC